MSHSADDFDKITSVLIDFFRSRRIQDSLTRFVELDVTGWEKWWQTEMAVYLASCDSVAEWDMEHPFDADRRTSIIQSRMALDIGFRLKRHSTDAWYFVELKQHDDYEICLKRMVKDAEKAFAARKRSFDGLKARYVACAGIFADQSDPDQDIIECAETMLASIGAESDRIFLHNVGKHHTLIVI